MKLTNKSPIAARAKIMHKAYIDYMNSIGVTPVQSCTESIIYSHMYDLMYQMSDRYLSLECAERTDKKNIKIVENDIQRNVSSTSHREVLKRAFIDKLILSRLSSRSKLSIEQQQELKSIFDARILGWGQGGYGDNAFMPSLPPIERFRGVVYSSSIARLYREALELNGNYLRNGSIWAVTSTTPDTIRAELINRGIAPSKIFIHTEESFNFSKIRILSSHSSECQQDLMASFAFNHLNIDGTGFDAERASVTYSVLVRALTELNGDKYILSPDDLTLERLIELEGCVLSIDNAESVKSCIESFCVVLGVRKIDLNDLNALRLWDSWMSEVKVFQYHIKRMFTFEESYQHTNLFEGVVKGDEHHIFFGDRIAALAAAHLKDLEFGYRCVGEYVKQSTDRPSLSAFIEFNNFAVEGFCVMPAAARCIRISKNIFFGSQFSKLSCYREEFASIMANSATKVLLANGGKFSLEDEFLQRIFYRYLDTDTLLSCDSQHSRKTISYMDYLDFSFEVPPLLIC